MQQQNVKDNSKINFSYDKYTDRMYTPFVTRMTETE